MKKITVRAHIECLEELMDFVNEELERSHCPPELQININLAVEEVFMNVVNHAYPPGCGSAVIHIAVGEETIIRFEDTGMPYNPLEHPEPDFDRPPVEREIGGLGIFLVKKIMDKVEYRRVDDKNVLIISKKME